MTIYICIYLFHHNIETESISGSRGQSNLGLIDNFIELTPAGLATNTTFVAQTQFHTRAHRVTRPIIGMEGFVGGGESELGRLAIELCSAGYPTVFRAQCKKTSPFQR